MQGHICGPNIALLVHSDHVWQQEFPCSPLAQHIPWTKVIPSLSQGSDECCRLSMFAGEKSARHEMQAETFGQKHLDDHWRLRFGLPQNSSAPEHCT